MAEQIDLGVCAAAMERAAQIADDPSLQQAPGFLDWSRRVRAFSEHCARLRLKSYVPMLGTALLAKASNSRVDVFSLKAGDESPGAYDARRPAEKVLVPASQRHRFSLATSGPQPLNNQPFFREYRITTSMTVRGPGRPVLGELVALLHEIQQYRTDEATLALAAFVHVRRDYVLKYEASRGALRVSTTEELAAALEQLTRTRSEGGGRAQAAVGGLMDALFGADRVRVGKKNEPDRHMPGDVGVRDLDDHAGYARIIEVRDKNVPVHAALSFITKVADAGVRRAVLVAIATDQEPVDAQVLRLRAREVGLDADVFTSWAELVRAIAFASDRREQSTIEGAVGTIRARLIELELSPEAITLWDTLTLGDLDAGSTDSL